MTRGSWRTRRGRESGRWSSADGWRRKLRAGLRKRGCEVVVIESGDSSDLQLDSVLGDERVEAVRFTSGEEFGADLVVIATNLQPNTLLARSAGLEVNRGIVVNDQMETSDRAHFCGRRLHRAQRPDFRLFPSALGAGQGSGGESGAARISEN